MLSALPRPQLSAWILLITLLAAAALAVPRPAADRVAPAHAAPLTTPLPAIWVVGDVTSAPRGDGYAAATVYHLGHLGLTLTRLTLEPGASAQAALAAERSVGRVAAPDQLLHAAGRRAAGWNAALEFAPPRQACGGNLRVGMLDTGVDLDAAPLRGQAVVQRSFLADGAKPAPREHGTAVATLLVGRDRDAFSGLLPDTTLFSAAVLRRRGDGTTSGELGALFEALDWLVGEGVSVANMSFETQENPVLSLILSTAAQRGLVMTAAAGNHGRGAAPAFPAAHPSVLTATATDRALRVYEHATTGAYIDFAAPGVGVLTADPSGLRPHSGTSFAVPFLTAAAALEVARGTVPDATALRAQLRRHARDLGAPGKDDTYGWGLLDLKSICD